MAQPGDVITYTYSGAKESEDISNVDEVIIREMVGADGADATSTGGETAGDGGAGGKITAARFDATSSSTLELWVGEAGSTGGVPDGSGWGRSNGGGAESFTGAGGGSTEVVADGSFLAAADAGGGGARDKEGDETGGGGGARGGTGGFGRAVDGGDAQGSGFGGDGGNIYGAGDAGDGGTELGAAQLLDNGTQTSGSGDSTGSNGEITVAFDTPFAPVIDPLTEDLTSIDPTVEVAFSNPSGITRTNTIYRSAVASPSFPGDFSAVGTAAEGETMFTDSPPDYETTYTYAVTATSDAGVESDPSGQTSITTSSEGELAVTITNTNSPVSTGDTLDLDVEIENIGDYRADENIDAVLEPQ